MPKFLFSLIVLVLVTSCAVQPVVHAPDFLYPGKAVKKRARAMSPKAAEHVADKSKAMLKSVAPSSVILPVDLSTNLVLLQWQFPPGYNGGPSVFSYNLYFGTSPGVYGPPINFPNVNGTTNYTLAIVDQTVSTNPPIDLLVFPNGALYTNVYRFYFSLSAVGVEEGPLSKEITWPEPPWNTIVISWDTNRSVTLQQTRDFKNWTTTTNVMGTNVITLPVTGTNYFYRALTTNPPPVQLHINGEYIAP